MMTKEAKERFVKAAGVLKNALGDYIDAFASVVDSIPEITEATLSTVEEAVAPVKEAPAEKKTKKKSKKAEKSAPVETTADDSEETVSGHLSADDLEDMSYNDLKKLAAEMGIPAKGDRNTLIKKIVAADVEAPADSDDEEEVEEKPKKKSSKKSSKKKPEPEPEPEEEEEDDEDVEADDEDDEAADEIEEQVREMCEDMSVEDIADVLSNAGLSTKGKKQALIDRVVKGVKDGLIDIDDEDDEDDDDIDDDDADEADEYELNDTDNPDMTDERREAILALEKEIKKSIKKGKLTTAKMKKALKNYYGDDKESKAVLKDADDGLIEELYLDMKFNFIDDDGELHEDEEAYYVNEIPFCCGFPLEYDDDEEVFTCPHCGSQYPTGDDEDDEDDE